MLTLITWIGGLLIATGVIAFIVSGGASVTALIPAVAGLLLLITVLIGRRSDRARKHAMHAALVVALLGVLGSLMNVAQIGDLIAGTADQPLAVAMSTVMFVLLLIVLIAGVRSFIKARSAGSPA